LACTYPQPDAEELKSYYPDREYYAYETEEIRKPPRLSLRQKALSIALHEKFEYPLPSEVWYPAPVRRLLVGMFSSRYRGFPRYHPRGRIVDVGCGAGDFLVLMRSSGLDGYGVEINARAVTQARAKGLSVGAGTLEGQQFEEEFFDAIRFSHVLEHIATPRATLLEAHRILKPGGELIILVPNLDSLLFSTFRQNWFHLDLPRHLFHFTPATISRLLKQCGFSDPTVERYTLEQSFLGSFLYFAEEKMRRSLHVRNNVKNRLLSLASLPWVTASNILGRGDLLEVRAIK
jgi:SAM-dependent methyltransferase